MSLNGNGARCKVISYHLREIKIIFYYMNQIKILCIVMDNDETYPFIFGTRVSLQI